MNFDEVKQRILEMPDYVLIIAAAVFAVVCILTVLLIKNVRSNRIIKRKLEISDSIDRMMESSDFDSKYTQVLELVRKYVRGDGYFLYLYEKEHNRYKLKRVLFENKEMNRNQGGIDVSYGRIMPYAKESYAPPLMFLGALIPKTTSLLMEGRFPVMVIPVKEDQGIHQHQYQKKKI